MACSSCAGRAAARAKRLAKKAPTQLPAPTAIDLFASAASIPEFHAEEPVIINSSYRPPAGGWGVEVRVNGRTRQFDGPPKRIAEDIHHAYKSVKKTVPMSKVWDYLNSVWAARDPSRVRRKRLPAQPSQAPEPNQHLEVSPSVFGSRLWGALSLFGISGQFQKESWMAVVDMVTRLLDPQTNPGGCDECHETWTIYRLENDPNKVENEHQAAQWVYDIHNEVNKKLGKPVIPFDTAIQKNNWAFKIIDGVITPIQIEEDEVSE